jgi:hypothetical protein
MVSPFSCGAADDLVVDVGDVAHVGQGVAAGPQPARDHVEHHHDAGVAEMAEIVDRHAADVHATRPGSMGTKACLSRARVLYIFSMGKEAPDVSR